MNSLILGLPRPTYCTNLMTSVPVSSVNFFKLQAFPAIMYLFLKLTINKVPVN